jgi:uncharacterized protein (DUF433 family)
MQYGKRGKPCIREMRITVGTVIGLIAEGHPVDEILKEYPYLEKDDIQQCLQYASMRVNEVDVPLTAHFLRLLSDKPSFIASDI